MKKTSEETANKSVRFSLETDRKFTILSDKLGRSKQELFAEMVDYFYKSKKDPGDLNDEVLKKEISQGINRIISFIKTQEKDTLVPMLADVRESHREQKSYWSKYVGSWNKHIRDWATYEQLFSQLFRKNATTQKLEGYAVEQFSGLRQEVASLRLETRKVLETNQSTARREEALKAAFRGLLEGYMAQRDGLNSLTNAKAIEQLQKDTLDQIKKL